ncbi:hypothetical protein EMIT0P4_210082 [Pseudomonas sp. IT-P4]
MRRVSSPERRNSCGSELSRDSGGSATKYVCCADVIASKLAPTGISVVLKFSLFLKLYWMPHTLNAPSRQKLESFLQ